MEALVESYLIKHGLEKNKTYFKEMNGQIVTLSNCMHRKNQILTIDNDHLQHAQIHDKTLP